MTISERRHSPRMDSEQLLRAELVTREDLELSVLDLGMGGILVESAVPFMPNAEHEFRITTADGQEAAVLKVRTVYCHRRTASESAPSYSSGFAFLNTDAPATSHCIQALVDAVACALRRLDATGQAASTFTLSDRTH